MTHADAAAGRPTGAPARAQLFVRGRVQGVGFRWWVRSRALELGLVGFARNMGDGRVEVQAQGAPERVDRLVSLLGEQPSGAGRPGHVETVVRSDVPPRDDLTGFHER